MKFKAMKNKLSNTKFQESLFSSKRFKIRCSSDRNGYLKALEMLNCRLRIKYSEYIGI